MSRFYPLCLGLSFIFSLSANANGPMDPRLKWICNPTGNADLLRLEIRETNLQDQLYFREVYSEEHSQDVYNHFDWVAIDGNRMPLISNNRRVERVLDEMGVPQWSIGGHPAVCVEAREYKGRLPNDNSPPGVIVECGGIPFSDLTKIEILEQPDLPGSYYIVEHFSDMRIKTNYDFFGFETLLPDDEKTIEEKQKFAFPELTMWNGYRRTLHRASEKAWYLQIVDECTQSSVSISCTNYMY